MLTMMAILGEFITEENINHCHGIWKLEISYRLSLI